LYHSFERIVKYQIFVIFLVTQFDKTLKKSEIIDRIFGSFIYIA